MAIIARRKVKIPLPTPEGIDPVLWYIVRKTSLAMSMYELFGIPHAETQKTWEQTYIHPLEGKPNVSRADTDAVLPGAHTV
jgi:hypothetical protein